MIISINSRLGHILVLMLLTILMALLLIAFVTSGEAAACPSNLSIITDSLVQNGSIRFKFAFGGKSSLKNASVEYWVEDMAGTILKAKRQSSNLGWKTYTPITNEEYSIYLIKAAPTLPGCESLPPAEQPVIFKNQNPSADAGAKLVCKPVKEGISLYLEHSPQTAIAGEEFRILVGIDNHDNHTQEVQVYSYIYRASKHYSPSNTNLKTLEMASGESIELELPNIANASLAEPGDYRLKLVAEYGTNKTKELTEPITLIAPQDTLQKLRISYFGLGSLSKPELLAEINSTSQDEASLKLVMESDTDSIETELTLPPEEKAEVGFPLRLPLSQNHLFLKLYQNSNLIDISELVLENSSAKAFAEKPFNLVEGDLLLNTSKSIYLSSASRSAALVPLILLAASLILNAYFLFIKKTS
jgi:hypothetical protein